MNVETIIFIALIATAAVGALYLFTGYRLIRPLVAVSAFLITGAAGYWAMTRFFPLSFILNVVIAVAAGLLVGLLIYFLYNIGIFLSGVAAGASLIFLVIDYFRLPGSVIVYAAAAVVCLVIGFLAFFVQKPVVITVTAFLGALSVALPVGYILFSGIDPADFTAISLTSNPVSSLTANYFLPMILSIAGLLVIGILVQFFFTGKQQAFVRPKYVGKHRRG